MVTLANINLNNIVIESDSNIDKSKDQELQFSLVTGSDGEDDSSTNEEDGSNTFMEMVSDEPLFKVAELLNGRLKGFIFSEHIFNWFHRK